MANVTIAPPESSDKADWRALYNGYAEFYKVPMTDSIADTVWSWIHDPRHVVKALIAKTPEGRAVGLAHYREMPRPLAGMRGAFLDDLFVAPEQRGTGIAEALMDRLVAIAREQKWQVIRWITAEDNYRARSFYDRVSKRTNWLTYEIRP